MLGRELEKLEMDLKNVRLIRQSIDLVFCHILIWFFVIFLLLLFRWSFGILLYEMITLGTVSSDSSPTHVSHNSQHLCDYDQSCVISPDRKSVV